MPVVFLAIALVAAVLTFRSACPEPPDPAREAALEAALAAARERMVAEQIAARGVRDPRVLAALRRVPRHRFLLPGDEPYAYGDAPYPIGEGQTVSQPYVVATMTELLGLTGRERVLEIGTGCGYQAAVLAECAGSVHSIERLKPLADRAAATLAALGYGALAVACGDGYLGWPAAAPFEAILLACAAPRLPEPLIAQLAEGGRLVAPVDRAGADGGATGYQELMRYTKRGGRLVEERLFEVRFVPMRGAIEVPPAGYR